MDLESPKRPPIEDLKKKTTLSGSDRLLYLGEAISRVKWFNTFIGAFKDDVPSFTARAACHLINNYDNKNLREKLIAELREVAVPYGKEGDWKGK